MGRIGEGPETKETVKVEEGEKREVSLALIPPPPVVVSKPPDLPKPPEPDRRLSRALLYTGLTVGGTGLLIGAVTGLTAFVEAGDLKSKCANGNCLPPQHDELSNGLTMGNVSNVAFAIAGVGAAVALIGVLIDPGGSPPGGGPRASAWIGLGSVGVHGAF